MTRCVSSNSSRPRRCSIPLDSTAISPNVYDTPVSGASSPSVGVDGERRGVDVNESAGRPAEIPDRLRGAEAVLHPGGAALGRQLLWDIPRSSDPLATDEYPSGTRSRSVAVA